MPDRFPVGPLVGDLVRLDPLSTGHVDALAHAAEGDRSTFGFTRVPHGRDDTAAYVGSHLERAARGDLIPFVVVRRSDDLVVGSTSFLTVRARPGAAAPYAVEIGGTWFGAHYQRTGVNLASKLLLLSQAFGTWGAVRVDFKSDARNIRSRRALEALGARFEGVLRNWQPSQRPGEEDAYRDSAMFAVVADDWPGLAEGLRRRLAAGAAPSG